MYGISAKNIRMFTTPILIVLSLPSCIFGFQVIARSDRIRSSPFRVVQTQQQQQPLLASPTHNDFDDDLLHNAIDALNSQLKLSAIYKNCNVKVGVSPQHGGLGLIATKDLKRGDSAVSVPMAASSCEITGDTAKSVFQDYLPKDYDSWTGETGLMALQWLNEIAKLQGAGIAAPTKRSTEQSDLIASWLNVLLMTLSGDGKNYNHPLLWSEDDQEVLQSSTTNKIYRRLDDLEEDFQWLEKNVFEKDRSIFPERVDNDIPCFTLDGFKWAMSIVQSRSFFLDGKLRLIPIIDFCNHKDTADEIATTGMGIFGGKGTTILVAEDVASNSEVHVSYGPKSAAEYLLEHGFVPELCWKNPIAEVSIEMDPEDRFYDDKLDILEYETYELAPMDPIQTFDIVMNGPPDPAMIQFLRLRQLEKYDAFLLESIFRKEVWGFMAMPVSESNERAVVERLLEICQSALDEFAACPSGGPAVCTELRLSETTVLTRLITIMEQEKEGLDLKEYYQERRLKDLGLDSTWTPEDDIMEADLSFGQTRAPGGADYDW